MNKKLLIWITATCLTVTLTFMVVKHLYVLESEDLTKAMRRELPVGTPKAVVLNFIQKRHPMFCDDLGSEVTTRLSGLAEKMIYRKDIILIFEFGSDGKLKSFSKNEYLTFF